MFSAYALVLAASGEGADRAAVIQPSAERTVLVLADGAGGTGGGATAAERVIEHVRMCAAIAPLEPADQTPETIAAFWAHALAALDQRLQGAGGESTAVVVEVRRDMICGASVGDSGAWLLAGDKCIDLTCKQHRKPLLGSGAAMPVVFTSSVGAVLLVASDGLLKYAAPDAIAAVLREREQSLETAGPRLANLVRLKSGTLPDDVAVIVGTWHERVSAS